MQVDGYSLDAQRDKLRKYAAYEDMIVAREYSDEGFSGKNILGRQDFQWMLNDIRTAKIRKALTCCSAAKYRLSLGKINKAKKKPVSILTQSKEYGIVIMHRINCDPSA